MRVWGAAAQYYHSEVPFGQLQNIWPKECGWKSASWLRDYWIYGVAAEYDLLIDERTLGTLVQSLS